jgi:tetratricopeptide (TPR) repeat protein
MTELFSLMKSLNEEELKAIAASFRKFNSIDSESFLLEQLFIHIVAEKQNIRTDKQLSLILYKTEKLSAVARLKSRLFHFILEVLSSDSLLQKESLFDASDKQVIRIRKKMLQFRVIHRKKNRAGMEILLHLLNEITKEAKEYEQYDILVEGLIFKKYFVMLRKGFSEAEKIEKDIDYYMDVYKMGLRANDHYFNLITNQEMISKLKPAQKLKVLERSMWELRKAIDRTQSPSIIYIYKLLELDYLLSLNKHIYTIDVCLSIIEHLKKHRHLYRTERIGFMYDNISICQVYNQDFKKAVISSQKAQSFYPPNHNSFLPSKQQEFYACFYSGQYKAANEIIKDLLNFKMSNTGEFRYDKFLFLNACTLFKLGFYVDALAICNQSLTISQDKSRWDLGVRYLKFMCQIELTEFDEALKSIEALRKIISRKKQEVSSRDLVIYGMLNEYRNNAFHKTVSAKLQGFCKKLAAKGPNAWNYYTHEIIPIHSWLESKNKSLRK